MPLIQFSEGDTRTLGLRVGHVATTVLDPETFSTELIEGRYDLCRVKIQVDKALDAAVPALEEAGFPYVYAGGILRYEFDYQTRPYRARHSDRGLRFVPVGASREPLLERLVRHSFRDDPLGYHKTPYLRALISREQELDCLVEYHLKRPQAGRAAWIAEDRGRPVGFIIMTESDGTLHTDLVGILPEERSRGFFGPIRDFVHLHASRKGIREEEGARLDNLQSQNLFEQDGLEHFSNEAVYHVTPLLSRSAVEPIRFDAPRDRCEGESQRVAQRALDLEGFRRTSVRMRCLEGPPDAGDESVAVEVRVPIRTSECVVVVTEIASGPRTLIWTEYARCRT